jgi:dihydrolipoamide dehydrogenase
MSDAFDLAIIGAGPGGYVAAIRAAHRGLRVALVEKQGLGGVCLHTGCIPTKAMVASADLFRQAQSAAQWGITVPQAAAPLAAINARRQKVVEQLGAGIKTLLEKNRIQIFSGHGFLSSPSVIEVRDPAGRATAEISNPVAILLATGSRPMDLPVARRDGVNILNSDDLLAMNELPPDMVVLGGGYIGCEFASIFSALGSRVTIVEALDRLLPGLDRELGQWLERSFKRGGIGVALNSRVERVETGAPESSPSVRVVISGGASYSAGRLLVAVGRVPNTEGLGLENAGVALEGPYIRVDDQMRTSVPHIHAIGDVTGKLALAHVATAQARVVVENLAAAAEGSPLQKMNYDAVPASVFTHPEIATVGLTEEQAAARGIPCKVGRFPFAAIGKALASGNTEGFVKLIADSRDGRVIGGHIFGGHASELIGQVTLAVRFGLTAQQLTETIFAHPTLSESILEAAEGLFGKSTHVFSRR